MSRAAEITLIQHLYDEKSLQTISDSGFNVKVIPTPELRPIITWALDYWFKNGCERAPKEEAFKQWEDLLKDFEIDPNVWPEESVEWAIETLKSQFIVYQSYEFNAGMAAAIVDAAPEDRVEAFGEQVNKLVELDQSFIEPIPFGARDWLRNYLHTELTPGLGTGLKHVDAHTMGVQAGEIAVVGAAPKAGKSFLLCWTALQAWNEGKRVELVTLENSLSATWNRLVALFLGVNPSWVEFRKLDEQQTERMHNFISAVHESGRLKVVQPEWEHRQPASIVRKAQIEDVDALIIDQLSYLTTPDEKLAKTEQVGLTLRALKKAVEKANIPVILTHQLSREAVKEIKTKGSLAIEPYHMADSVEVERLCDHICAISHQTDKETSVRTSMFRLMVSRRVTPLDVPMVWEIGQGLIASLPPRVQVIK